MYLFGHWLLIPIDLVRICHAEVADAWLMDMRQYGSFHRAALKRLLSLNVFVKGNE